MKTLFFLIAVCMLCQGCMFSFVGESISVIYKISDSLDAPAIEGQAALSGRGQGRSVASVGHPDRGGCRASVL
jgi:hypothetical protein